MDRGCDARADRGARHRTNAADSYGSEACLPLWSAFYFLRIRVSPARIVRKRLIFAKLPEQKRDQPCPTSRHRTFQSRGSPCLPKHFVYSWHLSAWQSAVVAV